MNLQNVLQDQEKILILIDWHCLMCHGFARFALSHDAWDNIWFGALQDIDIQKTLEKEWLTLPEIDSVIVISKSHLYSRSTAVLETSKRLARYRQWIRIWYLIPESVRDYIYDAVARRRIWRFGQKDDCDLQSTRALQERVVSVCTKSL